MKVWKCSKKTLAREDTIIKKYFELTGNSCIPIDREYWTMCGQCTDDLGNPNKHSELDQILSSGLIKPSQFHGVDYTESVIDLNKKAYPDISFHCGDFGDVLASYSKKFNPAIVNADTIWMKDKSVPLFTEIMLTLSNYPLDVMLVCNMVSKFGCKLRHNSIDSIIKVFDKDVAYKHAMNKAEWIIPTESYTYKGTGNKSKTEMTSFIFYKK